MLDSLLSLDTALLISARGLVGPEYALILQITGESVVLWAALFLLGLWLYGVKCKDEMYKTRALMIFFTIILTFLVYSVINLGLAPFRPNPQKVIESIGALIPHPTDNSFPSGHALFTGAFLMALFAFSRYRWLITISLILGAITAFSRVVGGVHYPGDILGGWIVGGLGGYFFVHVVNTKFFHNHIYVHILRIAQLFKL